MGWPKDPERYQEARRRMSESAKRRMTNVALRHAIGDALRGKASPKQGRTFEDMYGPERAAELKASSQRALTGRKAPWVVVAHTGRKRPEGEKLRIAESMRQHVRTEEHKRNIGLARKGKPLKNKGRPLTQQHKQAMIEGMSRRWRVSSPTSIEITVRRILDYLDVDYVPSKRILNYVVDIYVPSRRLVIECDGTYWHSLPQRKEHDCTRDEKLRAHGYDILRLPEKEINSGHSAEILQEVFYAC